MDSWVETKRTRREQGGNKAQSSNGRSIPSGRVDLWLVTVQLGRYGTREGQGLGGKKKI